jgi:hypothetical protein
MNSQSKRAKIRRLYAEQGGRCKWCGKPVVLHGEPGRMRPVTGILSGKAATLDHVYHWTDPRRHEPGGHSVFVMACSTCNRNRGQEELIAAALRERAWPVHRAAA